MYLKKALVFLLIAIAAPGLLITCDNPFKTDMGAKVDVTPPVIENVNPVSGDYVKDIAIFSGESSAYRELKDVQVRVLAISEKEPVPLKAWKDMCTHADKDGWTSEGISYPDEWNWTTHTAFNPLTDNDHNKASNTDIKKKGWQFTLDTRAKDAAGNDNPLTVGADGYKYKSGDGFIKLQFRAIDPSQTTESIEFLYIIKNNPSDVKVTAPDVSVSKMEGELVTGDEIRGQITDRRGIKPGYPQIKIWPVSEFPNSEPADDDPRYGWAVLFLIGGSTDEGFDSYDSTTYEVAYNPDRRAAKVLNVATFTLPLFRWDLIANDDPYYISHPALAVPKLFQYRRDAQGERVSLDSNEYWRFKIKTSDTYIDDTMVPVDPPAGETEIVGYYPPLNWGSKDPANPEDPKQQGTGEYGSISLYLKSSEVPPSIELNNDDKTDEELALQPNPYITGSTSRKIALGRTDKNDFRLRVFAYQPDGISYATLEYSHPSRTAGAKKLLAWDDNGAGYKEADHKNGYKGDSHNDGKLFTFTANGTIKDESDNLIFQSSTDPYIFYVTAYVTDTQYNRPPREYTVYVYGDGPKVEIRSMEGAFSEPAALGLTNYAGLGGTLNTNPYVVNSVVNVSVNYPTPFSIMQSEDGKPMAKWVLQNTSPYVAGSSELDEASVLYKLKEYKTNPTVGNLAFLGAITETTSSGWVNAEAGRSFKFDTRGYNDGDELWLYIIAQDSFQNLGFLAQKLVVDQSTDNPVMEDDLFFRDVTDISSSDDLLIIVDSGTGTVTAGNSDRLNILEKSQGISLNVSDDDGINLDKGGLSITLSYLNTGEAGTINKNNGLELLKAALPNGNARDRSGVLTQEIMAQILYGEGVTSLYDGLYKVEFTVSDDVEAKVTIAENELPPHAPSGYGIPESKTIVKSFFFAVSTELPVVDIRWEDPNRDLDENSLQNSNEGTITGTVKTGLPLSKLGDGKIIAGFTPDVYNYDNNYNNTGNPPYANGNSGPLEFDLYADSDCTLLFNDTAADMRADAQGVYTYYWKVNKELSFDPGTFRTTNDIGTVIATDTGKRTLSLRAFDGLGNRSLFDRNVQVDNQPPQVTLITFYKNRGKTVHGKIDFSISATDDIELADYSALNLAPARWFLLPWNGNVPPQTPEWSMYRDEDDNLEELPDTVFAGQFANSESGTYRAVVNTVKVTGGPQVRYNLYVLAQDKALNINEYENRLLVDEIIIDQAADNPLFSEESLVPHNDTLMSNKGVRKITGSVSDNDGFSRSYFDATLSPPSFSGDYVQIRFPLSWDPNDYTKDVVYGAWLPVTQATLDSTGEIIRFTFDLDAYIGSAEYYSGAYFDGDGPRLYEIKIVDEPANKNPDGAVEGDSDYLGAAETVAQLSFRLDSKDPEITFTAKDKYTQVGPGGAVTVATPTYRNADQLFEDMLIGGYIDEANPELTGTAQDRKYANVTFKYGNLTGTVNASAVDNNNPVLFKWDFDWALGALPRLPPEWIAAFDRAPQGLQTITIEAADMADRKGNAQWNFNKDTAGPEIYLSNIARVIDHTTCALTDFPDGHAVAGPTKGPAWPSDWPYGDTWNDPLAGWDQSWKDIIGEWPSEFAFLSPAGVLAAIALDRANVDAPPVVDSPRSNGKYYIEGKFFDEFSPIWRNGVPSRFEYCFDGDPATLDNAAMITADKDHFADWEIEIPDSRKDGIHRFSLRVWDLIGNCSEINGLLFIIDRFIPLISEADSFTVGPDTLNDGSAEPFPKSLAEEARRVFSAAGGPGVNTVFSLGGTVADNNLCRLITEISAYEGAPETAILRDEITLPRWDKLATDPGWMTPDADWYAPAGNRLKIRKYIERYDETAMLPHYPGDPILSGSEVQPILSADGQYQWEWELNVLEQDISFIRTQRPADSTVRVIRITAEDIAGKRALQRNWRFYLDSSRPDIKYINLKAGTAFYVFDGGYSEVTPQGIVTDSTKIRDITYLIGKWDYAVGAWRWYDTNVSTWTLTTPPPVNTWPSMLNPPVPPPGAPAWPAPYTVNDAEVSKEWTLTCEVLKYSGMYPETLFAQEGKYRIDICATDWSLSSSSAAVGNPHDTSLVTDSNFSDTGTIGATPNTAYNPSSGLGNNSGRGFYVDTHEPLIEWVGGEDKTWYKADGVTKTVTFGITVSDANDIDIAGLSAKIVDSGGIPLSIPIVVNAVNRRPVTIEGIQVWMYDLTLAPVLTDDGTAAGTLLGTDTYTLELTVFDGTGTRAITNRTKIFNLDTEPPVLRNINGPDEADPGNAAAQKALAGRISIRGISDDNSGKIAKTAFYVANNLNTSAYVLPGNPQYAHDFGAPDPLHYGDPAYGWFYYSDDSSPNAFMDTEHLTGGTPATLVSIDNAKSWELVIPSARNLTTGIGEYCVNWTESRPTGGLTYSYDGRTVLSGDDCGVLTIYVYTEDEAGNGVAALEKKQYWIWPEGDRPTLEKLTNPDPAGVETDRLLNGTIRVAGKASDNERVKNVWISVKKAGGAYYTNLQIPDWNTSKTPWTEALNPDSTTKYQSPQALDITDVVNPGAVWYKANGGNTTPVSWWVVINSNGELDGQDGGTNDIEIEVRVEDTTLIGVDQWDTGPGFISKRVSSGPGQSMVSAQMVAGAPEFDNRNEKIKMGASASPAIGSWENINYTNIGGTASAYRIPVRSTTGISRLVWAPTVRKRNGGTPVFPLELVKGTDSVDLFKIDNDTHVLTVNTGTGGDDSSGDSAGMSVKAEPMAFRTSAGDYDDTETPAHRAVFTANELTANEVGTKFIIWDVGTTNGLASLMIGSGGGTAIAPSEIKSGFIFTLAAVKNIGDARIMKADDSGYFHWLLTVDIDSTAVAGAEFASKAVRYPIYLTAYDTSKSTPLSGNRQALLPIDNMPPIARYTTNPRFAGSTATIGGEAADPGDIGGLQRVIMWFSRKKTGGTNDWNGETFVSWHEKAVDGLPAVSGWTSGGSFAAGTYYLADGSKATAALPMPAIPGFTNGIPSGSDDENDTDTGGDYAIVIYDTSNKAHHGHTLSTGFAPGGIGTTWYTQINSYGLESGPLTAHFVVYDKAGNATYYHKKVVVMNGAPMIDRIKLGTNVFGNSGLSSGANASVDATGTPVLNAIRGAAYTNESIDVQKGITPHQTFITSPYNAGPYGAVRELADGFNVRNNLLAFRVETLQEPISTEKARTIRFEYVSGAVVKNLSAVQAGKVYIIKTLGDDIEAWGAVGADWYGSRDKWKPGFAFLASNDGVGVMLADIMPDPPTIVEGTAWELNSSYYGAIAANGNYARTLPAALDLGDIAYNAPAAASAKSAEFVYKAGAFGTAAIKDVPAARVKNNGQFTAYPDFASDAEPWLAHSLFIVKIFDGPETDAFGDFTLLSVNVNNNDATPPFTQLYDLNPKTEGQDETVIPNVAAAHTPKGMGQNRSMGGLYSTSTTAMVKSGHIEPRQVTAFPGGYKHTLTSEQMGGSVNSGSSSTQKPWADASKFRPDGDTVSGTVILRGYVEDDQRIDSVVLLFYSDRDEGGTLQQVEILNTPTAGANAGTLQAVGSAVYFTEYQDLYRHRVEWAYSWNTAGVPANRIVGDITVRAVAYNSRSGEAAAITASANKLSPKIREYNMNNADSASYAALPYNTLTPEYPYAALTANVSKYNTINMTMMPYIAGFKRQTSLYYHNRRSLQGWYAFSRGETVVVDGFSIGDGTAANTVIRFPARAGTVGAVTDTDNTLWVNATDIANVADPADTSDFGISAGAADANARYKKFVVPDGAVPGPIRLLFNTVQAANTAVGRNSYTQPWNVEYDSNVEGSDLWDDYTSAHIWRSEDAANADGNGYFTNTSNWSINDPAMTMAADGTLWASSVELGPGAIANNNVNRVVVTSNGGGYTALSSSQFNGNIVSTDIAHNGTNPWVTYSQQGRNGNGAANSSHNLNENWTDLGGVYVSNQGAVANKYLIESTWYNSSFNSGFMAGNPSLNQFSNSHIAMNGNHVHTSYYDKKDGSIKYKYHDNTADAMPAANSNYSTAAIQNFRTWVNLDGGFDGDDRSVLPNTDANTTAGDGGAFPTAISGGTAVTLQQGAGAGVTISGLYLREVRKGVGDEVSAGDTIYVVGSSQQTDTNTTAIKAARSGVLTQLAYRVADKAAVQYTTRVAMTLSGYTPGDYPRHRGDFSSPSQPAGNSFDANDIVNYNGKSYVCLAATTSTVTPDVNTAIGYTGAPDANHAWCRFGDYGETRLLFPSNTNNATNVPTTTVPTGNNPAYWSMGVSNPTWLTTNTNLKFKTGDMIRFVVADRGNAKMQLLFMFVAKLTPTEIAADGKITGYPHISPEWKMINGSLSDGNTIQDIDQMANNGQMIGAGMSVLHVGLNNIASNSGGPFGDYYRYTIKAPEAGLLKYTFTKGGTVSENAVLFTIEGDSYKYRFDNTTSNSHWIADVNPGAVGSVDASFSRIVNAVGNDRRSMTTSGGTQGAGKAPAARPNVGEYNAIALTQGTNAGKPVIAYYDKTNNKLKMAVYVGAITGTAATDAVTLRNAANWRIVNQVIPSSSAIPADMIGEYVSMQIDSANRVHIAALKSAPKQLVYISGNLNLSAGVNAGSQNNSDTVLNVDTVQVVDNLGDVGRWCSISLDADDKPWIAYQDEQYEGLMDGVKMAFLNPTRYTKYLSREGGDISGWETMHVPAQFRVEDARIGMEWFGGAGKTWNAAVGYLASNPSRYRIAYYMKQQ